MEGSVAAEDSSLGKVAESAPSRARSNLCSIVFTSIHIQTHRVHELSLCSVSLSNYNVGGYSHVFSLFDFPLSGYAHELAFEHPVDSYPRYMRLPLQSARQYWMIWLRNQFSVP